MFVPIAVTIAGQSVTEAAQEMQDLPGSNEEAGLRVVLFGELTSNAGSGPDSAACEMEIPQTDSIVIVNVAQIPRLAVVGTIKYFWPAVTRTVVDASLVDL